MVNFIPQNQCFYWCSALLVEDELQVPADPTPSPPPPALESCLAWLTGALASSSSANVQSLWPPLFWLSFLALLRGVTRHLLVL